jgi:transcriptional regulator with XRE-family HTH domain
MKTRLAGSLPLPAQRALRELGADIRNARRRRRIPTLLLAERAGLSRATLAKVQKGDPGTSIGAFARVLFVLGMIERLAALADPGQDSVGLALDEERLPQRIRIRRPRPSKDVD